jgi:hypothetical protein
MSVLLCRVWLSPLLLPDEGAALEVDPLEEQKGKVSVFEKLLLRTFVVAIAWVSNQRFVHVLIKLAWAGLGPDSPHGISPITRLLAEMICALSVPAQVNILLERLYLAWIHANDELD